MSLNSNNKFITSLVASTLIVCLASVALGAAPHHSKHHKTSAAEARKIALKRYPGKVIGKVALENEEGKMQYSVNIRSGHTLREVMVDQRTGKIASSEVTTKEEEAKEARAEKKHSGRKK